MRDDYDSESLLLKGLFNYSLWFDMTPLKGDEEKVREEKGLKSKRRKRIKNF